MEFIQIPSRHTLGCITNTFITRRLQMADFDQELDASGLNCPLPILRAKKTLGGMDAGQVLRIIATDPGSVKDFEAFAKQTGNELLESTEEGGKFHFLIKKV
jgi:tRNA 2-thiouridine synthesizing protein A